MKTTKKDNQDTIEDDKEIQPWKGQRNATKQQETKKTKKQSYRGVFLLVRPKSARLHVNPFKKVSELDPVGSTVRYEMMKLCTGSV